MDQLETHIKVNQEQFNKRRSNVPGPLRYEITEVSGKGSSKTNLS